MKTNYQVNFLTCKPANFFFEVKQTHSNIIVPLHQIKKSPDLIEADGIFWNKEDLEFGQSIAVKTADCLSVYLESSDGHYLIHAGWRGVYQKIFQNIKNISYAQIFPSIKNCCFEVTKEFYDFFPKSQNFLKKNKKIYFDLTTEAKNQIMAISPNVTIKIDSRCTFCSNEKFHSFRRDKTTLRNYTLVTN